MTSKFLFILLLVVVNVVSCMSMPQKRKQIQPMPKTTKRFRLSLVVPSSFCKKYECKQKPENIVLQGFFPQQMGSSGGNTIGDVKSLRNKADLVRYWPYLLGKKDVFHSDYYQKFYKDYGSRCDATFTMEEYFSAAIRLAKTHGEKIYKALVDHGIRQNDTETHRAKKIRTAIRSYTGREPQLACVFVDGRKYLNEIIICFDEYAENSIDCIGKRRKDCKDSRRVIFPSL